MLADVVVILRWTEHSIGLTGWGAFILMVTLLAITDIGNKRR